jgi:hypothetical protein
MDASSFFTHIQITSRVESMLCMPHAKLWMVRFHWIPHSNQKTQASIEFYHRALKNVGSFFKPKVWKGAHQLVNVEANHNCGMTLYAPSLNEEASVHKKTRSWHVLWWQMLTKLVEFHTPMWPHLPLRGMMVINAPLKFLKNSIISPKVKIMEKGIKVCS